MIEAIFFLIMVFYTGVLLGMFKSKDDRMMMMANKIVSDVVEVTGKQMHNVSLQSIYDAIEDAKKGTNNG